MRGNTLYILALACMVLLAGLGLWAALDGAAAHKNRPLIERFTRGGDSAPAFPFFSEEADEI